MEALCRRLLGNMKVFRAIHLLNLEEQVYLVKLISSSLALSFILLHLLSARLTEIIFPY